MYSNFKPISEVVSVKLAFAARWNGDLASADQREVLSFSGPKPRL